MKHHRSPTFLAGVLALLVLNGFRYGGVKSFVPSIPANPRNVVTSFLYKSEDTDGPGAFFMSSPEEKDVQKKIKNSTTPNAETEKVGEVYEKTDEGAQNIIKQEQETRGVSIDDVERQIAEALELADAAMFYANDSDGEPEAVSVLKKKKERSTSSKVKREELKKSILDAEDKILETASFVAKVPEQTKKRVEDTVETVQSIPGQVQKKVNEVKAVTAKTVETVTSIPKQVKAARDKTVKNVEHTVETVQSIPSQVQQKVDDVKAAAGRTKKSVEHTVDEVKAIPGKVQKTAKDVKSAADNTVTTVKAIPGQVKAVADKTKKTVEDTVETVQSIPGKVQKTVDDVKVVAEETAEKIEYATDVVLGLAAKFEDLVKGRMPKRISQSKPTTPRPPQVAPPAFLQDDDNAIYAASSQPEQHFSFDLGSPVSSEPKSSQKYEVEEDDVPVMNEKEPSSPSSSFSFKLGSLPKKETEATTFAKTYDGAPESYYESKAVEDPKTKGNKPFPFAFGSLPPKSPSVGTSTKFDVSDVAVSTKTKKSNRAGFNRNFRP
eukprot:CAMPEP_0195292498 /NCGR_PEP_ID=MMETSP0707-20130614/9805_1 /TAXON_ID=33640 /ORGANISM="Asterionellopsis glacialis, Strain CCMP134" /LENGTH=548 /DNA_ID=CAMNT_0040352975 /DNA_START=77 /DNA_END=1723 /DNA_ORIENTATION=+